MPDSSVLYFSASNKTGSLGCAKFLALNCKAKQYRRESVSSLICKHYSRSPCTHLFSCTYYFSQAVTWMPSWQCQTVLLLKLPALPSLTLRRMQLILHHLNKQKTLSLNRITEPFSNYLRSVPKVIQNQHQVYRCAPKCPRRCHSNGADSGIRCVRSQNDM